MLYNKKNMLYNQTHSKISVWTEIHNAVTPKSAKYSDELLYISFFTRMSPAAS